MAAAAAGYMDMPSYSLSSLGQDEEESRRDLRLRARSCSVLDISSVLAEAAGAIVDDSFTCCLKSSSPGQRKWNVYRFPLWCLGVVIRLICATRTQSNLFHTGSTLNWREFLSVLNMEPLSSLKNTCLLIRVLILIVGWIAFFILFFPVRFLLKRHKEIRTIIERKMIGMMCHVFVASWNGMVKYHGPLPSRQSDQVFVANHTSIIDFIILEKTTFAVVMQEYSGWIGFLQKFILESVGCIRFNRNSNSERESVPRKLQEHVQLPDNNPLLIFPEGTCVNNHYTVMFKKQIMPGETAIAFAERVRDMIAAQVGLKKVPWDGYMKHNRPGPRHTQEKQRIYAESALRILEENYIGTNQSTRPGDAFCLVVYL